MSRGKRGTCNYKMMTFRISLRNLEYVEWLSKITGLTKGQTINNIILIDAEHEKNYFENETFNPRQSTVYFEENKDN